MIDKHENFFIEETENVLKLEDFIILRMIINRAADRKYRATRAAWDEKRMEKF